MKKLFKTVAVVAAALAVGLLASCKMNADLGDDVGNWKGVDTDKKATALTVKLVADDAPIEWWCWSDAKGQIIVDEKINPTSKNARKIAKNSSVTFTFPDTNEYRLSIYQKPNAAIKVSKDETFNQNDKDFRGAIKPHKSYGRIMKSSGHAQEVTQQAEYYFTNDEPIKGTSYFYNKRTDAHGDYTIKEVWILELVDAATSKYKATENLKYTKLDIKKGDSAGFLIPVKDVLFATSQPDRAKNPVDGKYAEEWLDWGQSTKDTAADKGKSAGVGDIVYINKAKREAKEAEYWGVAAKMAAHTSNKSSNIVTSDMDGKAFIKKGSDFNPKAALPFEYITVQDGIEGEK